VSQVRRLPQSVPGAAIYDAVVNVDNADLVLKPGMIAKTQIIVAQKSDVLRVPDQALRFAPSAAKAQSVTQAAAPAKGQSQIWVLRGSEPVAVSVVTGLDDGNLTEIARGELNPGDQVIVAENRLQTNNSQSGSSGAP
jgi:HlyD family secretion protein